MIQPNIYFAIEDRIQIQPLILIFHNNDLGTLSFKQDSSGKWGYKVGGADPVIPFNSNSTDKLYNSLKYSDFGITENMTFDEICDVLAKRYPAELNLLSSEYFDADSFITIGSDYVQFTNNGGTAVTTTKYSKFVMNNFKTLTFAGDWHMSTDSSVTSYIYVDLVNESGSSIYNMLSVTLSGDRNSKSDSFNKSFDVSSYMQQNLRLKVTMYHRYQDKDYVKITTLKLS